MTGGKPNAIILAAGAGSRLLAAAPVKPLAEVRGRALILHALDVLAANGVESATLVLGNSADAIAEVARSGPLPVRFALNPEWAETPNGVSLLAAAGDVRSGTLLMMADHLLAPSLVARVMAAGPAPLALGVDRRLGHPWIDEADVTRVRTRDGRIEAIGKSLKVYDCLDTGLFRIGPELVSALSSLASPSLSQGVAALARAGQAHAVDIGDAPWLDVDDPRALALANASWVQA